LPTEKGRIIHLFLINKIYGSYPGISQKRNNRKRKVAELEYEVKTSGKTEEDILIEKGIISEEKLFEIKSGKMKIPLKKVYPEDIGSDLLELIPEETAEYYKMVPWPETKTFWKWNALSQGFKGARGFEIFEPPGKISYESFSFCLPILKKFSGVTGV